MSRSYKKHPSCWGHNKGAKKYANHRFRRFKGDIANGNAYRKYTEPYDICDYGWFCSWKNYCKLKGIILPITDYAQYQKLYGEWIRCYKGK